MLVYLLYMYVLLYLGFEVWFIQEVVLLDVSTTHRLTSFG